MRLVGGTALALQIGHRKSIDIDLFGEYNADDLELTKNLSELGEYKIIKKTNNILVSFINGIKVDIVNYPYKWLEEPILEDGIIMASKTDIAAMKISAITGRGTKKDFIDLFYLLKYFSVSEIMTAYENKYHDSNVFVALKSIYYFADADKEIMPFMIEELDWDYVKAAIKMKFDEFTNIK